MTQLGRVVLTVDVGCLLAVSWSRSRRTARCIGRKEQRAWERNDRRNRKSERKRRKRRKTKRKQAKTRGECRREHEKQEKKHEKQGKQDKADKHEKDTQGVAPLDRKMRYAGSQRCVGTDTETHRNADRGRHEDTRLTRNTRSKTHK